MWKFSSLQYGFNLVVVLAGVVVEHLFNCQSNPTQLTAQHMWDDPAVVADFLNLDN